MAVRPLFCLTDSISWEGGCIWYPAAPFSSYKGSLTAAAAAAGLQNLQLHCHRHRSAGPWGGEEPRYDGGAYASSSTPGNFKLRCVWDLGSGMILRMRDDMLPPLTGCIPVQGPSIKYVGNLAGRRVKIAWNLLTDRSKKSADKGEGGFKILEKMPTSFMDDPLR